MKASIKAEITTQKENAAADKLKDDLITELISVSDVTAPEVLVADQMRSIEQDFAQNLMYRGADLPTYLSANGFKDEDDWREKEVKPAAERRVQAGLVLSELTKAEKITARYSRKLMNCLARLAGKNPFDIRDILGSSNKLKKYDHETRNAKINLKDSNSSRNSDKTESYRQKCV
jgi:FKBP-type peptidyl-prolyl cis-trans isomerase (trigger factor)